MKDRSLFHLLMARLRQLTSGLPAHERDFVESLQGSLKIEQSGDWFSIAWRSRNKQYDLNVPGDTFHFYVRGDTGKAPAIHGGRAENWKSAEALLRRIAELSGEHLPADPRPGSLNIFVFDQTDSAISHELMIVPGLVAGLIALALTRAEIGFWTAVAAISLAYWDSFFRHSLLRRPAHWLAPIVIAIGALVPSYFMTSPASTAVLALSIALFARAELLAGDASILDWIVPGVATGGVVLALGPSGWVAVAAIGAFILLTLVLMPRRMPMRPVVASLAAAVAAATLATLFSHVPLDGDAGAQSALAWIYALIIGTFAVTFLLGWVFGQQFLLFPWAGLGVVGASYLAVLLFSTGDRAALSFTALAGFGICAVLRLFHAFAPHTKDVR